MNFLVVIPARYRSTRFPGKPLADLDGSPMIEHVWRRCCQAVDSERVIIATDDERIEAVARGFGARVEMTSSECLTGTDRVAEVAQRYPTDWYLNVQGDEPFVSPLSVRLMIRTALKSPSSIHAINAFAKIHNEDEFRSPNVPKVLFNKAGNLLFISRSPVPTSKNFDFCGASRQLGLYALRKQALNFFGAGSKKTPLETIEDIEILRLLEHSQTVRMVETQPNGPAIDTPEDLDKARDFFSSEPPCT